MARRGSSQKTSHQDYYTHDQSEFKNTYRGYQGQQKWNNATFRDHILN